MLTEIFEFLDYLETLEFQEFADPFEFFLRLLFHQEFLHFSCLVTSFPFFIINYALNCKFTFPFIVKCLELDLLNTDHFELILETFDFLLYSEEESPSSSSVIEETQLNDLFEFLEFHFTPGTANYPAVNNPSTIVIDFFPPPNLQLSSSVLENLATFVLSLVILIYALISLYFYSFSC